MVHPRTARRARDVLAAVPFVLPALFGLAVFVVLPFALAVVWLSTHNIKLPAVDGPPRFLGLDYYRRLFLDVPGSRRAEFLGALRNNATFAIAVVVVQTGCALGLALALKQPGRLVGALRAVFFVPVVFPMVLVAVIWRVVYASDRDGLLNSLVHALSGGRVGPVEWLTDPRYALASIVVLSIWQGVGFQMVIILAGLQSIPETLYEAATVDRAGRFAQFRHVTLPALRNTLVFVVLTTTVLALRLFDQVQILTPNNDATRTVLTLAVEQSRSSLGQAAATSVVFFVLTLAVTVLQRVLLRQHREVV